MLLNSSPHRWGDDPVPGDASVRRFCLAKAMNSLADVTGTVFGTNMKKEKLQMNETGAKSAIVS